MVVWSDGRRVFGFDDYHIALFEVFLSYIEQSSECLIRLKHPLCKHVWQEKVFQGNLKNSSNIRKVWGAERYYSCLRGKSSEG
jgi:hypothetical protein